MSCPDPDSWFVAELRWSDYDRHDAVYRDEGLTAIMCKQIRDERLLDLTGLWPTQAGASMALGSGPRPRARAWARAIYTAYPRAEGVWYGSSLHANTPYLALFERAQDALAPRPQVHRALADATLRSFLANVAADLSFRLVI